MLGVARGGALVGLSSGCDIQNVTVSDSTLIGSMADATNCQMGAFVGNSFQTNIINSFSFNNVISSSTTVNGYTALVGGFVGNQLLGSFTNCVSYNNTLKASSTALNVMAGGIAGLQTGDTNNCQSYNNIINATSSNNQTLAGGIAASCNALVSTCISQNNTIYGSTLNETFVGGVCGYHSDKNITQSTSVNNSITSPNAQNTYVGGISAFSGNSSIVVNSTSRMNTLSGKTCGGIISLLSLGTLLDSSFTFNSFVSCLAQNDCVAINNGSVFNCFDLNPTITPSTLVPSTQPPTTTTPSTQTPSTNPPTTTIPSTVSPSTLTPNQTTEQPTVVESTLKPSTLIPSTVTPSTFTPSTFIPSTTVPSTVTPSTQIPSTQAPKNCLYNVVNCENCPLTGLVLDTSQFLVSCEFKDQSWVWVYKNSSSNSISFNSSLQITNTTFFEGNLNFGSNSNVTFLLERGQNNVSSISNGCLVINGTVTVFFNQKPNQTDFDLLLFKYNCPQLSIFNDSQLQVVSNYTGSDCDQNIHSVKNQQNNLFLSLKFKFGGLCQKNRKSLIIGLSLGIPLTLIAIAVVVILILKHQSNKNAFKITEFFKMKKLEKQKQDQNNI